MLDKLEAIYSRYQEIEQQMNDPQITADMKRYVKLSKDYKDLGESLPRLQGIA